MCSTVILLTSHCSWTLWSGHMPSSFVTSKWVDLRTLRHLLLATPLMPSTSAGCACFVAQTILHSLHVSCLVQQCLRFHCNLHVRFWLCTSLAWIGMGPDVLTVQVLTSTGRRGRETARICRNCTSIYVCMNLVQIWQSPWAAAGFVTITDKRLF